MKTETGAAKTARIALRRLMWRQRVDAQLRAKRINPCQCRGCSGVS